MSIKELSAVHSLPLEKQYEALEMFINSKLTDQQAVTHADILAIGKKLIDLMGNAKEDVSYELDSNDYLEQKINQVQSDLEAKHDLELKKLEKKLMEEKSRELGEMKTKYEELIDRITEIHAQSESTKLKAQKRNFEQELKDKLEAQAQQLENEKIEALEKERLTYYGRFCEEFSSKIEEAVNSSRQEQQKLFDIEKEQIFKRMEQDQKNREELFLKELQKKYINAEKLIKLRYGQLYVEFENVCRHFEALEKDYQELQHEFQRFIDSAEPYFHSDYLLKLRYHAIDHCRKNVRVYKTTLTSELFTPNDFDRSKYI